MANGEWGKEQRPKGIAPPATRRPLIVQRCTALHCTALLYYRYPAPPRFGLKVRHSDSRPSHAKNPISCPLSGRQPPRSVTLSFRLQWGTRLLLSLLSLLLLLLLLLLPYSSLAALALCNPVPRRLFSCCTRDFSEEQVKTLRRLSLQATQYIYVLSTQYIYSEQSPATRAVSARTTPNQRAPSYQ